MAKKFRLSFSTVLWAIGILLIVSLLSSILWVAYYSKFDVKKTPQMMFYKFGAENDSLHYKVEYQWIPLDSISRNAIIAVLAAEDKNFYVHDGFAPIEDNDSTTTKTIPESYGTITQKAAHAVFLTRGNSWIKNILEPYYTVLEEYLWGKDRILEIYLNTMPVGKGVFGIEAASRIFFNKGAGGLTMQEAAFIAALIETPQTVDPANPKQEMLDRQKTILLNMALMMHIKIGKKPIDEKEPIPAKPIYRRKWRG